MTYGPDRFAPGVLFEWAAEIAGVRVELLAEVETAGTTVHLRDIAIYPVGMPTAQVGAAGLVRALRRALLPELRAAGFERVRITGTRLSGARPGRSLDISIDLGRTT